jgi:hypothetical protein
MHLAARANVEAGVVPLHSAVLCVDCESITMGLSDECLVCGSHSLFNLERLLGGTQPSGANARNSGNAVLFDTDIAIRLTQIGPRELSAVVDAIGNLLRARQLAGQAEFHIGVEPVIAADSKPLKAA